MNLSVICKKCESKFRLDNARITSQKINLNGEDLKACIMTCPVCHNEFIVQIDNDKTMEILAKLKAKMREIHDCISRGEQKSLRQMAQVKNLNCQLGRTRKQILNDYADEVKKQTGLECYFELLDS